MTPRISTTGPRSTRARHGVLSQTQETGCTYIQQKLQANLDPALVKKSGIKLRLAMVSLESGKTRYVNEQAQFIDDGTPVDLITAIVASASIPAIFPPQKLGSEIFVDGGIRDVLPIQAAFDAGADQVFAIAASRAGIDSLPPGAVDPWDSATIWDIVLRAAKDIMPDQIQSVETKPAGRGWPPNVTVIQPDTDAHDSMTIDPGLIRIAYAFGHMRAAEMADFSQSNDPGTILKLGFLVILSRQITDLRREIWGMEHRCAGQRTPEQQVVDPESKLVPDSDTFRALHG